MGDYMANGIRMGWRALAGLGTLGISLAVLVAPAAAADPVDSAELEPQVVVGVAPAPLSAPTVAPVSLGAPTVAPVSTAPADGVPHLPSPDNLPPGTTQAAPEGPNMSYLRYLWQAVHTPGVTMSDALILIAQRPLDAKAPTQSATPAPADFPPEPASP
jgi:hypothetical protein